MILLPFLPDAGYSSVAKEFSIISFNAVIWQISMFSFSL